MCECCVWYVEWCLCQQCIEVFFVELCGECIELCMVCWCVVFVCWFEWIEYVVVVDGVCCLWIVNDEVVVWQCEYWFVEYQLYVYLLVGCECVVVEQCDVSYVMQCVEMYMQWCLVC